MTNPYLLRSYRRDLTGLDENGSRCEACGGHMHDHEWADLDPHGVVAACSEEENR